MKIFKLSIFYLAAAVLLSSCINQTAAVYASFTTDKDVYEVNEDIYLTNTSYAENTTITSSKWEWGLNSMYGIQPETPISFDTVGEHEITLTVTTTDNLSSTCVKTVTVQDTNIRPVAAFTYQPETGIIAGQTQVQFTDQSYDEDGTIVSWQWQFGTTVVTERNPEFTFTEYGDIEVTLTVTDNVNGTGSTSATITVERSDYSMELLWEQTYETDVEAYIRFTSPATNADGSRVYVLSSGYNLVAYSNEGERLWTFDGNLRNPNPYTTSDYDKKSSTCTPSVDTDGTVYMALGYNEAQYATSDGYESGVYAVNPDGSQKWYFAFGSARYINVIPMILNDQIVLVTKYNPTSSDSPDLWSQYTYLNNGHILNKNTGAFAQTFYVKQGCYGGVVGLADGQTFIAHCNDAYGSRIYFLENGTWTHYGSDDQDHKSLGYYNGAFESGASSQMAVGNDGKVYILYSANTSRVSTTSVLYCYDPSKYVKDALTTYEPEWTVGINGAVSRYMGLGVVCGADGTIYATTATSGTETARVTAVSSSGTVLWEHTADGNIAGSAAVDNEGYIYYNDRDTGKLVKLNSSGTKVAELQLCSDMRSSPTISVDGTIYCVGMKSDLPTLFAVQTAATGPADSWSQLGGNPSKTCVSKY